MECDDLNQKKGRHRKKQLYNSILQQMEFYFSDSNLSKDRFLSQLILSDPYIDLEQFLKFNKITKLSSNVDDIRKAVKKSNILELSEDGLKVKRKTQVKVRENVDNCTIYVERLQTDTNHEFLHNLFSDFGKVTYVSIPKYKHNQCNKGFAFIEFETEQDAVNAVEFFDSIGCKMSSGINPEELGSIIAFNKEKNAIEENLTKVENGDTKISVEENGKTTMDGNENGNKRKFDDNNGDQSEICKTPNKKIKTENLNNLEDDKKVKEKNNETLQNSENDTKIKTDNDNAENSGEDKKKKKKEHKKKNFIKELGIQVLSKKEWKKMRNRYLDLQRKKMKEIKMHLNKSRFAQQNYRNKSDRPKNNEVKSDIKTENMQISEESTKLEFTPGVIVKLKLSEACPDEKKFKNDLKTSCSDIKFVDYPLSVANTEVFLRFSDSKTASDFCKNETTLPNNLIKNKDLLNGPEESSYWEKIHKDRAQRFSKNEKKNQRGKDKLLKKAEKELAKHIRFDKE